MFRAVIVVLVVLAFLFCFIWPGTLTGGVPIWTWMTGQTTGEFFAPPSFGQQVPAPATPTAPAPAVQAPKPPVATATPPPAAPATMMGRPSLYLETGTGKTQTWTLEILPNMVAIIGGYTVNGLTQGVYMAQAGPSALNVTVTDGFVAITKSEWGNQEFCFRVDQAIQYNWAHNTVQPLAGWTCQ